MGASDQDGLRIFVSYAHEDETFKNELDKHLKPLKRSGAIGVWSDRRIVAGQEWDQAIRDEMARADIFLLLVSSDFNASDYIAEHELTEALARHEAGTGRVVPIILRPCRWEGLDFAKLQALPPRGRPVSDYDDADEAYVQIAIGLEELVEHMRGTVNT